MNGDENQNRMKSSDIERYFMRDYIPGDRERDINWKASSRLSGLFTRISPVTQEKTQLITIFFRPYNSRHKDSVETLALLDRCKSMLLFFLRTVNSAHPEYQFRVFVGNDLVEIEGDEEIKRFASEIGAVHFRGYGGSGDLMSADVAGGAYVFTTSSDAGLNEFLRSFSLTDFEVYRSYSARRVSKDDEGVKLRLFDELDSVLPGFALMSPLRELRTPIPISLAQKTTDEPVEVRFA